MAKIAVVKPYPEYAKMIAALIQEGGHEVIYDTPPIDWERLLRFEPQLLIAGLFRKRQAFNRPLTNFDEDVLGHEILEELLEYPAALALPLLLLGNALEEPDIPYTIGYDAFLIFPDEMHHFLDRLKDLIGAVQQRRQIAPYACPHCHGRMTYTRSPKDLFCPRCHTSAAIVDEKVTMARTNEGTVYAVETRELEPPEPQPPKPGLGETPS